MIGHAYLVVANRNAARMFEIREGATELQEIECLMNPNGRTNSRDMVTDRPGSMSAAGSRIPGSDAMAGKSPADHNLDEFATRVAKSLDERRKKDKTYHINIIAEPQFLGALRKRMNKQTEKLVWRTLDKDLVGASPDALLKYMKNGKSH
ncbi:host attachment protein [Aliiglaciecola sp. CAU 1673]|uniref:host attachment protein n=1 Tax=Aliiglaciecola sp. CAU 1673 TaxID=3032595 RepID=UPI0023DBB9DC|nr:host attachment protein [Aliiglaciecola sp. CAU 1673]MDF2178626.1 host attachment protein [Aliiglaciecola sp. CAU 1673]